MPTRSDTLLAVNVEIPIDKLILTEKIVLALQSIKADLGWSLHEAIDEFQRRYARLLVERPNYPLSQEAKNS